MPLNSQAPHMNKRRSVLWSVIMLGLALQLICGALGDRMPTPANIYAWLGLSGTIILLLACALCAEEKGYSRNYGLLAFLSIIGVIMLAMLPRRNEERP
jgi:hypothetical protein